MCLATTIRVRPATAADAPALAALDAGLTTAFERYPALADAPDAPPHPHPEIGRTLVLEWSGTVLGAARWSAATDRAAPAILHTLVIAPAVQRAGFARRLLGAVAAEARVAGLERMEILAPVDALPALSRLGARPTRVSTLTLPTSGSCAAVVLLLAL